MIGRRFARLIVIKEAPATKNGRVWLCRCDCGTLKNVRGTYLRNGNTKSCGCYRSSVLDLTRLKATGSAHPKWKGDNVSINSKRKRARRLFVLDKCEKCGAKAEDRHHKDRDPGNNEPSNIIGLCRPCHIAAHKEWHSHRDGKGHFKSLQIEMVGKEA